MAENKLPIRIYLDDVRTPHPDPIGGDWIVVRNYDEFVSKVQEIGLKNIHTISLDHDLGDTAVQEYYRVKKTYSIDYDNIEEKTGYDCAKWLVDHFYDTNPKRLEMDHFTRKSIPIMFPTVYTHSANPIGSANIMGYINNFYLNEGQPQTCIRILVPHTV